MPLSKYAQQAGALAQEAIALLDEEQAERVRTLLAGGPHTQWQDWKAAHGNVVSGFVQSTPAVRKKQYLSHPDYPLIVYAAYEQYWHAQQLLRLLAEHRIEPGLSYRAVADEAAQVVQGVVALTMAPWPFHSEPPWPEHQETLEAVEDRQLRQQVEFAMLVDSMRSKTPPKE